MHFAAASPASSSPVLSRQSPLKDSNFTIITYARGQGASARKYDNIIYCGMHTYKCVKDARVISKHIIFDIYATMGNARRRRQR